MANNVQTFYGNITADPELRYTGNGTAVTSFTIAQSVGFYDREKGEYVEKNTAFLRVSAWRGLAENVAQSLHKGQRVTVVGVLEQTSYEDKEGNKRTSFEVTADDVSVSLLYGKAEFVKIGRTNRSEPNEDAPKQASKQASKPAPASSKPAAPAADDDDDDDF
ncbi:single-stranded DNA-binding protein [Pseudoclavibacter soli]|uniref:single-stranded DNA-binding protein n=1 Tax=Pseudoclavibacter soli TaxID=452623 RepID=UPI0004027E6A|nr:single-stranded DNA-binding protein [Pseudoclavibacter soli]